MAVLLVARHGETAWNRERRIQGHLDPGLNDAGRDQAQDLALRVADGAPRGTRLFCSDLRRARETAQAVGGLLGSPLIERADLRERGMGILEGRTYAQLAATHPDEVRAFRSKRDRDAIPGIEPWRAFKRRALRVMREIAADGDAVVVTHGGLLRVVLNEACGSSLILLPNAALFRLQVDEDGFRRV